MSDSTISCARMRDLARLGRSRLAPPGRAGLCEPYASHGRPVTDAFSIADDPSARPRAAGSRPEADDPVELTILSHRAVSQLRDVSNPVSETRGVTNREHFVHRGSFRPAALARDFRRSR